MKALVIYDSYGAGFILGEVEKETDKDILKPYREPDKVHYFKERVVKGKTKDLKYKNVLGEDFIYLRDCIGLIDGLMESYVCPLTEEQFTELMKVYKNGFIEKEEDFKKFAERYYNEDDPFKRIDIFHEILGVVQRTENEKIKNERYKILYDVIDRLKEKLSETAIKTGEKQPLSARVVERIGSSEENPNYYIIKEWISPKEDGTCEIINEKIEGH